MTKPHAKPDQSDKPKQHRATKPKSELEPDLATTPVVADDPPVPPEHIEHVEFHEDTPAAPLPSEDGDVHQGQVDPASPAPADAEQTAPPVHHARTDVLTAKSIVREPNSTLAAQYAAAPDGSVLICGTPGLCQEAHDLIRAGTKRLGVKYSERVGDNVIWRKRG